MFYSFTIVVPANTPADQPIVTDLKLTAGVINWVEVRYRYGPSFLVKVRLFQGGDQVWPTNKEGEFKDDGRAIAFSENFPLDVGNNIITAVCYSPGTIYDHEVDIRIGVLPQEVVTPLSGIAGMLNRWLNFVGVKG